MYVKDNAAAPGVGGVQDLAAWAKGRRPLTQDPQQQRPGGKLCILTEAAIPCHLGALRAPCLGNARQQTTPRNSNTRTAASQTINNQSLHNAPTIKAEPPPRLAELLGLRSPWTHTLLRSARHRASSVPMPTVYPGQDLSAALMPNSLRSLTFLSTSRRMVSSVPSAYRVEDSMVFCYIFSFKTSGGSILRLVACCELHTPARRSTFEPGAVASILHPG